MRLVTLFVSLGLIVSLGCRETNGPGFDEAIFSQFSPAPERIPDVRSPKWAHAMGPFEEEASFLKDAKAEGAGVPAVLIDGGICADSNEPCSFTLTYVSSQRVEGDVIRDWVIRWMLRSDAGVAEGVSHARRSEAGEPLSYQHFKRTGDQWVSVEEGSDEFEILQKFSSAVVYIVRYIAATQ